MIEVNGTTIEEPRVLEEMQYHPAETQREAMFAAAETLIIGELLKQRAEELGLDVRSAEAEGGADDHLEQLLELEVAMPEASEAECREYFNKNPDLFRSSPLLAVRHILIGADPEDDAARVEGKALSEQLIQQLQQGGDFAGLARAHSDCPSKETGGSLGQISKGQTVPEFERQLFPLPMGLHTDSLETRYGFHVVWIEHKEPGQPLPYSAVQERIAEYLNEKVQHKAISQYISALISEARIKGYDFDLERSPLMQ